VISCLDALARGLNWTAIVTTNAAVKSAHGREVNSMLTMIRARFARQEGQTMAEYAVVLAVITVATVAVFTALSGGISGALSNVTAIL
jgi:Flp pilus assembly pilin Flp